MKTEIVGIYAVTIDIRWFDVELKDAADFVTGMTEALLLGGAPVMGVAAFVDTPFKLYVSLKDIGDAEKVAQVIDEARQEYNRGTKTGWH